MTTPDPNADRPDDVLAQPPGGAGPSQPAAAHRSEDLGQMLQKRSGPKLPPATLGLIAVVLLGVGFAGGMITDRQTHKANNTASVSSNPGGNFRGRFPYGGPSGNPGGNLPGGGFTAGTVERVDGDTVYIKTQDGKEVKVTTTGTTTVRMSSDGKVSDLQAGQPVAVQGQTGNDGSVAARSITEGQLGGRLRAGGSGNGN
ncbi:MAG: hypothetical protein ACJ73S_09080 [Mycobacteriales bacterium]